MKALPWIVVAVLAIACAVFIVLWRSERDNADGAHREATKHIQRADSLSAVALSKEAQADRAIDAAARERWLADSIARANNTTVIVNEELQAARFAPVDTLRKGLLLFPE